MNVVSQAALGALAGAAGTAALDVVTYADMALRGRPPSGLPDKMARKLADLAGCEEFAKPADQLSDRMKQRRAGIAALLGYADGFGTGAIVGLMRPALRDVPLFWAGIGVGALGMIMSEGAATVLGQTDPLKWPFSSWVEDIVPRCVYGWITCIVFDAMMDA
ncbi:MAG TPA: hypothetical protein VIJ77_07540 [Candidatus Tumulicola sp.]